MNNPSTPAIVAQSAVRRLPRRVLLLLGAIYVLAGFLGREPWKNADIAAFGYMAELAGLHGGTETSSHWLAPSLLGMPPEIDALLPYWLGAFAIQALSPSLAPELAARIPFMLLLAATLASTWYAVYHLARSPLAQPVAFAFGGEAQPADYARAVADGGLLALLATLGLAQLSHEVTPALAQLSCVAAFFYACAALRHRTVWPAVVGATALGSLALSGAPAVAVLLGAGTVALLLSQRSHLDAAAAPERADRRSWWLAAGLALLTCAVAAGASLLDLWRWRIMLRIDTSFEWGALGRLLLWFTWPAWPLALWTLWRWRGQLLGARPSWHLALPLWFVAVPVGVAAAAGVSDRALLLGLPALAALAAFALPTLRRSMAALIDWFTLLFFTGCAAAIWFLWVAMQTGVPSRPAANVARQVPGFVAEFEPLLFALASIATLTWGWLVRWRVGRHRAAIWKSVVLPAGGAVLCWLLLTTLWLPLFDYARSYGALVQRVTAVLQQPSCVEALGLTRAQIAAFRFHARLELQPAAGFTDCPWLLVDADALRKRGARSIDAMTWSLNARFRRPGDNNEEVLLYRRRAARPASPAAPMETR